MKTEVTTLLITLLILPTTFLGNYIVTKSLSYPDSNKEYLLRSYELENQRIELENQKNYLRTLELKCTSEFINQYGEIYKRQ